MMLAFSSLSDAHFHLPFCGSFSGFSSIPYFGATCAHSREELEEQEERAAAIRPSGSVLVLGFGIHPQLAAGFKSEADIVPYAEYMETLLAAHRIQAVGEAGFDFFTKEYKEGASFQEEAWDAELALAASYGVPVVIHCRKAMDRMFRDARRLSRIPSVVFHSFPGSPADARSLLNHGLNAFFSFGKPLINGDKSAAACVRELDAGRLLMETDAPYQTLKGEKETKPEDILRVYNQACVMRNEDAESFSAHVLAAFKAAYGIDGAPC